MRFGVDEVVTTLLLNFIVLLFVAMLLEGPLKDPMGLGWPQSPKVIAEAQLPQLIAGQAAACRLLLALVAAVAGLVHHDAHRRSATRCGRSATMPRAARFAGMPGRPRAGEDGAALGRRWPGSPASREVPGLKGNLTLDLSPGFGYTGIVVAMLAHAAIRSAWSLAAIFVAGIFVGADAMSRTAGVPSYIADVMVATVAADHGRRRACSPATGCGWR